MEENINSVLNIEIKINNDGNLEVIDSTPYESLHEVGHVQHLILERAILNNDVPEVVAWYPEVGTEELAKTYDDLRHNTIYPLTKDGLYHYQKLVLPTKDHIDTESVEQLYYVPKDQSDVEPEIEIPGKIHYCKKAGRSELHVNYDPWEDFDEIYEKVISGDLSNCFWYGSDTFSIYNMVKCYVSKEYERLQNQFKNNCVKCESSGLLDYETDILLAAVNVASNLIEEKNYLDALRIVNGLDTCGKLCKDSNKLKGCGCGRN